LSGISYEAERMLHSEDGTFCMHWIGWVSDLLITWLLTESKNVLNQRFYPIYTDNCTVIRYKDKQCVVKLLNFSVVIDHLHEGIQQQIIHGYNTDVQQCT
jgi:hypothetical protein